MSKIVLYPANGFDFDAADVAAYLAGLTSGVFSSAEDFPVTAAGGLTVTVGAGRGWVHPSRFTGYSITKRESDTLALPLADPSLPRIDRIVMRYDAGARAASLQVLQGHQFHQILRKIIIFPPDKISTPLYILQRHPLPAE